MRQETDGPGSATAAPGSTSRKERTVVIGPAGSVGRKSDIAKRREGASGRRSAFTSSTAPISRNTVNDSPSGTTPAHAPGTYLNQASVPTRSATTSHVGS